jgi:acyl carrier protein
MSLNEFLELLEETIDCEESLSVDMELDEIEEYDSIAILSLMSMYDEMNIRVSPKDFENFKRVSDLINLAGDTIE